MKQAYRLFYIILAAGISLLAVFPLVFAQNSNRKTSTKAADETIVVEGIGSGVSRQDALHDAMRKAIEKAVGMYVMTKTVLNDGDLKEQIIVASDAVVTNYKELDCVEHDDMWMIKIKAKVLPNEYLKYCPKQISDSVSSTEIGNILNKHNTAKNTEKLFQEIADNYLSDIIKFKKESITISASGDITEDKIPICISFSGKLDQNQFEKFLNRLSSVLDRVSLQKTMIKLHKNNEGRYAEIPEDIAENLWKKAGLTKNDKDKYSFVAFRYYKNGKLLYSLYLVPLNVRNSLDLAMKVRDRLGRDTFHRYLVLSISYAKKQKTEKKFFELDHIGLAYYDESFPMMGLRVYESYCSPLTFTNNFYFKPKSFGKIKSTRKSNVSVAGSMELSLSEDEVKRLKNVYIYPLSSEHNVFYQEGQEQVLQACDKLETKYWNSK